MWIWADEARIRGEEGKGRAAMLTAVQLGVMH